MSLFDLTATDVESQLPQVPEQHDQQADGSRGAARQHGPAAGPAVNDGQNPGTSSSTPLGARGGHDAHPGTSTLRRRRSPDAAAASASSTAAGGDSHLLLPTREGSHRRASWDSSTLVPASLRDISSSILPLLPPLQPPGAKRSRRGGVPPWQPRPDALADARQFDPGVTLEDLVRVPPADYDSPRSCQTQVGQLLVGGSEVDKAMGMMLAREVARRNPRFTLPPASMQQIFEALHSRNRLLRPCAAAALAAIACQRSGRDILFQDPEALPRLMTMLQCKLDSLDAIHAAMCVANCALNPRCKEYVGASGTIPLLIGLARQSLGPPETVVMNQEGQIIKRGVANNSRQQQKQQQQHVAGAAPGAGDGADGAAAPVPVISAAEALAAAKAAAAAPATPAADPMTSGASAGESSSQPAAPRPSQVLGHQRVQGQPLLQMPPPRQSTNGTMRRARRGNAVPIFTEVEVRFSEPKQAAINAVTALLNLADTEPNRRRIKEAGGTPLVEHIMSAHEEHILYERCKLLQQWLESRFSKKQAGGRFLPALAKTQSSGEGVTAPRGNRGASVASTLTSILQDSRERGSRVWSMANSLAAVNDE